MKSRSFNLLIILALLLSFFGGAATATPAYALSVTPLATMPTTNGSVSAMALDGAGGVYIGGDFTQLMPAGGGPAVTRNNIAHINADGSIDATWNPNADGWVYALAVSGSTVYVGGDFNNIGGQNRSYIAALNTTNGNAINWTPNANGPVLTFAVSGSIVYAGGLFANIGGQTRSFIAALDATTGNATAWDPNASFYVQTLVVSGNTVYAGGGFTTIGGQSRNYIAALDATTGNATAWDPNADALVRTLAVSGNTVYASGDFTTIGGQYRNFIAALDATTGNATTWDPHADASVNTLAVSGSTVYAGGGFYMIGGKSRRTIGALDATTGSAIAWSPGTDNAVNVFAISGSTVYVGGYFTTIGGQTHQGFAAFGPDTTAPTVSSQTLQANYTSTGPDSLLVTFSEEVSDPAGDSGTDDASNPNNYKIINKGANGTINTASCASAVGGDDTLITPLSAIYMPNIANVYIGSALPVGSYRLFVCGTTSIVDLTGNPLAGDGTTPGTDFTFDFTVGSPIAVSPTFSDVPVNYWAWQYIEAIYAAGITGGCSADPLSYCPTDTVTRAQMAVFLLRSIHGGNYTPPAATGTIFGDVPADYWAADWIEALSVEGITAGCGNENYCPENTITRAEMSIFLLRAKYGKDYVPPAASGAIFADVPADHWAAGWIEQLFHNDIARGCGNSSFCPDGNVTRDQMAVFLQKTFNLSLP